jgi:predicted DNA binding CopG/RHH family protein
MTRRMDQKQASTVLLNLRVTPEERDEIKATARYLGLPYSDYLRKLHKERRAALIAQGLRPPKTPRDPGS